MARERQRFAGIEKKAIDPRERIEVLTTGIMTDGRNLMVRGKLRNPMPETVDGVRLLFKIYQAGVGSSGEPLETIQQEKDIAIDGGDTAALRMDVQTMYAGGASSYRVEAYAIKVGDHEIPPPPDWRDD